MGDWTDGYVSDIEYTYGYFHELNPLRIKLAFLNAGLAFPEVGTACELAFGQGMSINSHAAATVVDWYGTDFNPSQVSFAQELAAQAGSGAQLFDQAFEEFCQRPDLPDFDVIALHGIWSWVSDANRSVIVDFIRRTLKPGGVVYVSYNTQPGWAAFGPMQHLLRQHGDTLAAPGYGSVSRVGDALAFAERLMAVNPAYAKANPQVKERLDNLKGKNRQYLAHEYFNRDWHPMHFSTTAEWLAPAKLSYACSAHLPDHVDAINLTQEQQALLKQIPDSAFREDVRDFIVNKQFRRDYWVKGLRQLSALEQAEGLREQRVMLTTPRSQVALKVKGALGEADLSTAVYTPLLDLLADHQPQSLQQIEQALQGTINLAQLRQAVMLLTGAGHLSPVQDEDTASRAKPRTDRLNEQLMKRARASADIAYLVSPVTGGGVAVPRFQQLFLLALSQGHEQPEHWAQFVWQLLAAQGQRVVKEGKPLESAEQNLAELTAQAQDFDAHRLSLLKALQIA
ncbi:methyltransferase regulatory domain-containing protein [Halomonas sp. WWR20]